MVKGGLAASSNTKLSPVYGDNLAFGARKWRARAADEIWHELCRDPSAFRVLTGERTTGALHIGH
jgi:hypothetical protein